MATRTIPLRAAHSRRLYVTLGFVIALIAFVGFWPSYFGPLAAGDVDKPAVIHFHAAVYVGWLALFIAQTGFAAAGRVDLHMRLGRIGIGYGVLVIAIGLLVAFYVFGVRVRSGALAEAQAALFGPLADMVVFAPLFFAAVHYRRKPEIHKRLMIVATTALLIAAVARMPFFGTPRNLWLLQLVWMAPILLAMGHDLATRRIVHPVYALGLAVFAIDSPFLRGIARQSDIWGDVSLRLADWVR